MKMTKQGQSLLDFINYLPLQSVNLRRSPISNKEASVLYGIWDSSPRDKQGSLLVPDNVDATTVASLTSKGLIESSPSIASILGSQQRAIRITPKGQSIIKNIVLYTEKSTFEKQADKEIDYESIFIAVEDGPLNSSDKTASWFKKASETFVDEDVNRLCDHIQEMSGHIQFCQRMLQEAQKEGATKIDKRASIADVVDRMKLQLHRLAAGGSYCQDVINHADRMKRTEKD